MTLSSTSVTRISSGTSSRRLTRLTLIALMIFMVVVIPGIVPTLIMITLIGLISMLAMTKERALQELAHSEACQFLGGARPHKLLQLPCDRNLRCTVSEFRCYLGKI
ncbi:hypothetical protein KC19_3G075800 [Ceratodon purpureus]|uniref:Uncharacterized protein n=1 Tax=Ceratodon purpureus TaxID=3225 RepID=A0A8T0IIB1_CERPU|nr:hypothetical protein KC19_3G075800 [Ceratodon purpureus]